MNVKKFLAVVSASLCLCLNSGVSAFAESVDTYSIAGIAPLYETAKDPYSNLSISGTTATCTSSTKGESCVTITVTHTLQKYSGWFWIWEDVDDATWSKTINSNTVTLSSSKSGLSSGKYRLESTFELTNTDGKVETVTIRSAERTIA